MARDLQKTSLRSWYSTRLHQARGVSLLETPCCAAGVPAQNLVSAPVHIGTVSDHPRMAQDDWRVKSVYDEE